MDGITFSIWAIFWPFTLLTAQKIKIKKKKKMKKMPGDINILHKLPKIAIICHTVPEIWHVANVIVFFILGYFFKLLSSQQPKKYRFRKNEKKSWRYPHFTRVYQKS